MGEFLLVISTLVIAFYTHMMAKTSRIQHSDNVRIADFNYRLALFEKRYETFSAISRFISSNIREGKPKLEEMLDMRRSTQQAKFIFPREIHDYIETLTQKTHDWRMAHTKWEPLRKRKYEGEELSENEEVRLKESLEQMHEIEDWFMHEWQTSNAERIFSPYLILPEKIAN